MKFYTQQKSSPVVPIVSLIDILAILLIFFIFTTTFKTKKALLNIALPKSSQLKASGVVDPRLTLSVTPDQEIFLEGELVLLEDLADTLIALREERPDAKLELQADESLPLGILVEVWDALNKAGIKISEVPARIQIKSGS